MYVAVAMVVSVAMAACACVRAGVSLSKRRANPRKNWKHITPVWKRLKSGAIYQ